MVVYFCYHLSDNHSNLADLYVALSVTYAVLSEKYPHNQQLNILFLYRVNALTAIYLSVKYLTSRHNDLPSLHYYLKVVFTDNYVDFLEVMSTYLIMMSTCQIILLLSVWHSLDINTETYNRLVMLRQNAIYCNKRNCEIQMHQSLAICVRQQSVINNTF